MAHALINIDVDDLARATNFYCQAFDLNVGRRFGTDGIELLGGGAPIYLLAKRAGSRATAAASDERSYERHWTPVHLDFVVDEIHAAVERARAAGAHLEAPVATHRWGHIALMADPFGHGFCLIQFVGRGYDEISAA
jgi:predicted enzyme related to lactoylglutathione lyase